MPKKENATSSQKEQDGQKDLQTRLKKLIIRNFRAIGSEQVEIDLDDIVTLVGANNAGKSSVLRAYQVAMCEGEIEIDDFPNRNVNVDREHMPEIELQHLIVSEGKPGNQWIKRLEDGQLLVRERWYWKSVGKPIREGFNVEIDAWSDKKPWGFSGVAKSRRSQVHYIDAFSSPKLQEDEITKIVDSIVKGKLKEIKESDDSNTDYNSLVQNIDRFQKLVFKSMSSEIHNIEEKISEYLSKVFRDYVVEISAREVSEKTYLPFKDSFDLFMGPSDGYKSSVSFQGSGARRTLMWSALKYIGEYTSKNDTQPHILLLDEPEVCLHPSAIRVARDVLYDLASNANWQVMITTHSPVFIDLSRDNTTIIRVERNQRGDVNSTTLYRPKSARLSADDKENLKLLNVCDPYVHEFFFGGRVVVVEGDTEYTAFSYLKMNNPEYEDVHIVRARGKAIIPSLCKIMNQFDAPYAILHDADSEETKDGNANPMWTENQNIRNEVNRSTRSDCVIVTACIRNFEEAFFHSKVSQDKPYNALLEMKSSPRKSNAIKQLFDSLLDINTPPPKNCVRWNEISELQIAIGSKKSTDTPPEQIIIDGFA